MFLEAKSYQDRLIESARDRLDSLEGQLAGGCPEPASPSDHFIFDSCLRPPRMGCKPKKLAIPNCIRSTKAVHAEPVEAPREAQAGSTRTVDIFESEVV
ncbi:MAG: hypothetical protein KDG56_17225 [Ottowia sp.]|uniref:hypothetical protein n=1 Tax=Ottowia sp. TaxID=1898956 RepID=UPI001DB9BD27|nr:hypothetical protein [Ottowia sp.]MCB2026517.1 hypothetical protein [Ottowia sp.]MCB2033970.1 hypothetical protein [Ottowia sp.]HPR45498.1 hypothetical protein [Ottowia sp.]HRW73758.1 hypothetical protein [Ottowia sp.]